MRMDVLRNMFSVQLRLRQKNEALGCRSFPTLSIAGDVSRPREAHHKGRDMPEAAGETRFYCTVLHVQKTSGWLRACLWQRQTIQCRPI